MDAVCYHSASGGQDKCRELAGSWQVTLALLARQEAGAASGIEEQILALGHVLDIDLRTAVCLGEDAVHKICQHRLYNSGVGGQSVRDTAAAQATADQPLQVPRWN